MSTDYDSWHDTNETVTVEMVMGHMGANAGNARRVVGAVLDELGEGLADGGRYVDLVEGKKWEGSARGAGGMTKREGRGKEAVKRLKWLFDGGFGEG